MSSYVDLSVSRGESRSSSRIPGSSRSVRSGGFRSPLLSAAALTLSIAASGQAMADWGAASISELDLAVIEVASDGENYTTVLGSSPAIKGRMTMFLDTHRYGRVKSWALWPSIKPQTGNAMGKEQFQELGYSKSYPLGDRPKRVTRDVPFSIPVSSYKVYAKQVCNQVAYELRNYFDKSNEEIFAIDRLVPMKVDAEVTWEMSGSAIENPPLTEVGPSQENLKIKTVTIKCLKAPPIPPAITGSAVVVQGYDPVNFQGQCQLKLNGSLISNLPNVDVTFRYVDDKGKQSDLKSVTTNANRSANFEHKYPLSPGHKTGKIRIVGQNFNFTSNWKNYDFECSDEPTNDLLTLLPPEATLLHVGATALEVYYKGHICPVRAKMIGGYKGRGPTVSGRAVLAANGRVQEMKPFSINDDEIKYIDTEYNLDWEKVQGPLQQDVEFAFVLYNAEGGEIDRITRTESMSCRKPVAVGNVGGVDGLATGAPMPKSMSLSVAGTGTTMQNGYSCPAKVLMTGNVQNGPIPLSGNVVFFANGEQVKQDPLALGPHSGSGFSATRDLDWTGSAAPGQSSLTFSGPALTEQTVAYAVKVFNPEGLELGKKLKTKKFICMKIASVGKLNPGGVTPPPTQATGKVAIPQTSPEITILAPRNRIRNGKIRLSGAKSNQVFSLKFLRKTKSGYKLHNSAQLPKQMTGKNGSFNLKALGGGDWRLSVCQTNGNEQFIGPQKCKQSNFYLPKKKKPLGKIKTPGKTPGSGPKPKTYKLVPGIGG